MGEARGRRGPTGWTIGLVLTMGLLIIIGSGFAVAADQTDGWWVIPGSDAIREIAGAVVAGAIVAIVVVVYEDRAEIRRDLAAQVREDRATELINENTRRSADRAAELEILRHATDVINATEPAIDQVVAGAPMWFKRNLLGDARLGAMVAPDAGLSVAFENSVRDRMSAPLTDAELGSWVGLRILGEAAARRGRALECLWDQGRGAEFSRSITSAVREFGRLLNSRDPIEERSTELVAWTVLLHHRCGVAARFVTQELAATALRAD